MIGKKIFGIGAGILMLLLSIAPTINATGVANQIKENEITSFPQVEMKPVLTSCEYQNVIQEGNEIYVIYKIDYKLIIEGTLFKDKPQHKINTKLQTNNGDIKYEWEENISGYLYSNYNSNTFSIPLTKKLRIRSSEEISKNEEILFAGQQISLIVNPITFLDINLDNNIDFGYSKYYNDDAEYQPTKNHILLSTPHIYEKITKTYNDTTLYKLDIKSSVNKEDDTPTPIIDRLGYIYPLINHILLISNDLSDIFELFIAFYYTCRADIFIVLSWIEQGLLMFKGAVSGIPPSKSYFKKWVEKTNLVVPAVGRILTAASVTSSLIITKADELYKHIMEFVNWLNQEPWNDDVQIDLKINLNTEGEQVGINCRDVWITPKDEDKDKLIKSIFTVSSEPTQDDPIPKEIWWLHNCQIRAHCRDKTKESFKILSYSFSSGKIKYNFNFNIKDVNFRQNIFCKNLIIYRWITKIKELTDSSLI